MQLPNFKNFEPFNQLRQKIGTNRLGTFELFNPSKHLTGKERSELETHGKRLKLNQLTLWADHTWGIKNTRLLVYLAEENIYHLANCTGCQALNPDAEVWVSTRLNGALPPTFLNKELLNKKIASPEERQVCPDCLQLLGYQGFDLTRNRKIAYSKSLLANFNRQEFYQTYTLYPVRGMAAIPLSQAASTNNYLKPKSTAQNTRR